MPIPGSDRALDLGPATGAMQYVITPGDIAFTPDGSQLLVTTKNNTNAIDVFRRGPVRACSRRAPVVNSEPGDVPFALAFEGNDQVAVGEAGTDAVATFKLHGAGTLTPHCQASPPGRQPPAGWLQTGSALFAGNAGSGTESTVLDAASGAVTLAATTSTDAGTVDATVTRMATTCTSRPAQPGSWTSSRSAPAASLTKVGAVTVPNAVGGEGIAAS